jgi:hypothetical protein
MKRKVLLPAVAAAIALGACDDYGDDGYTSPPPPPPPPARLEDQFGARFGTAFRANANAEPIDPMAGDIIALSLTTDPIAIPDPSP